MNEYSVLVSRDSSGDLRFPGTAESAAAHRWGMPHTTVLLVPAVYSATEVTHLVLHRRSAHKRTSPNRLDFCGGHVTFSERYFTGEPWKSIYDLEKATADAACREANEEIRCGEPPVAIDPKALRRVGTLGFFDCRTETHSGPNVEYSTCYIVAVPTTGPVRIFDTDLRGERELAAELLTLEETLERFRTAAEEFADGAKRILANLAGDPALRLTFQELLAQPRRKPGDLQ
jgi:8-oxo-dGTP pyrophosphatase MutT (NUDIX family)